MVRVSSVVSDTQSTNEATTSGAQGATKAIGESPGPNKDNDAQADDGEAGGDEEESEYEIEAIIDAKRGAFPEGRMGYLVKWKGYGEDENSWVDEQDAGNADVLIEEYWKKHPKQKKAGRKSTDAKTPKRGRKSAAPDDASEGISKKRGRKSHTAAISDQENNGKDEQETRTSKKQKKDAGPTKTQSGQPAQEEEQVEIGDMSKYMSVPSWEDIVVSVDTVEHSEDGKLTVYFRIKGDEQVKEDSRLCAERFPQKLIQFYEGNLRWRTSEAEDEV